MRASALKGVFVPVVTPFAAGPGRAQPVDVAGFRRNVRSVLSGPARGIVLFGSTGEFVALTEREKHLLLDEACAERADAARPLIAGVGNEGCEADVLSLARQAKRAGCDAVMVLPPHYFPQHRAEPAVTSFFLRIAEQSPLPLVVYSMPKCVDFEVSDATVAAVSKHENVIGIKVRSLTFLFVF
jgi:4-hydroxy-2-oxoglutarate aldolase